MKIVMLCDFYNEELEYQENLLVKYYRKHHHEVTVLTSTFDSVFDYYGDRHDKHAPARTYYDAGAKIVKLQYRYNFLNRLRALTSCYEWFEQEKPDLIYVHDIMPNIAEAVRYVKRHPQTKMILDYHADYSNSGKNWLSLAVLHGIIRKRFLDQARPYLERIFPIVPAGATFLHEVYKVPHSEMEVLPLGADTDLGQRVRATGEGEPLRQKFGIKPGDAVIFTGGKLAPLKRTELLIEAVKRINRDNVHLIVVGDAGEGERAYKEALLQAAAGVPNVHFTGWLSKHEIYKHLAVSDVAVFPASQSILWQQAISMGLPLVCGNFGSQDISYLNLHGNIVELPLEDITLEKIEEWVRRLLDDRQLREKMAAGAREVAEYELNWNRLIDRTLRYNRAPA